LGYTATTPSNVLGVMAEGEGGVTEIVAALPDPEDTEKYILLKKDVPVDDSKKLVGKFVFICYTPDGVKPARKGMISQIKSQVVQICKPYSADFSIDSKSELSEGLIDERLGVKSAVTDQKATVKVQKEDKNTHQSFIPASTSSSSTSTSAPVIRKSVSGGQPVQTKIPTQSVKFVEGDEERFRGALKALHESKDELPWVVVAYSAKDTLAFVNGGAGGDSLRASFPDDAVFPFYGLVRVDLSDGKSHTQKIVYVSYTNEAIPPMKKADASTKSGAISVVLGTCHAKIEGSKPADFTDAAIKSAK